MNLSGEVNIRAVEFVDSYFDACHGSSRFRRHILCPYPEKFQ